MFLYVVNAATTELIRPSLMQCNDFAKEFQDGLRRNTMESNTGSGKMWFKKYCGYTILIVHFMYMRNYID